MSEARIAIKVDAVSKNFILPHEKKDSVKSLFIRPFSAGKKQQTEVYHALKDISFEVKEGEFFGIVGRNGSGKSTLLKILASIYQPTKGEVSVNGRLVPFIELGVGFNPELTGRENVHLNGALLGFSSKEVDKKYDEIVSFAELEKFMDQKLKNYSSGMQVRLAFAVATILAESDILLIDEVLAVGDADFQRKCFDYFKSLKKKKKTVVFVSHDMGAIREYCDRAIMIEDSKIIGAGSSEKIARQYSKLFLEKAEEEEVVASDERRWGSGDITFSKVSLERKDGSIFISALAKAKKDVENLKYGISITGADGVDIVATNSQLINAPSISKVNAGQAKQFSWKIQDIFSDGKYSVSLTLTDHANVFDWFYDAAVFTVKRPERSITAILPPIDIKVTDVDV